MDEGHQSLRKARRVGTKEFAVWDVMPVTFAPFVRPETHSTRRVVLRATTWGPNVHTSFPLPFRTGVNTILVALKGQSIVATLPKELWFRIFSFLDREWLTPPRPGQLCGHCHSSDTSAYCGRCRIVRYCCKDCQRAHWKEHKKICEPAPLEPDASPLLSPMATPRLQAATPPQHAAHSPSDMSPHMMPAPVPVFQPSFHMGDLDLDLEDTDSYTYSDAAMSDMDEAMDDEVSTSDDDEAGGSGISLHQTSF